MTALRIVGDISKLPAPQKGLTKRILAKSAPKRTCPRCERDLPYDKFFHRSLTNVSRGLPTATASHTCNSCRHKSKRTVRRTAAG